MPHWQPWSARAQPAAVMAEERQGEAQAGCPERFCAVANPSPKTVVRKVDVFILIAIKCSGDVDVQLLAQISIRGLLMMMSWKYQLICPSQLKYYAIGCCLKERKVAEKKSKREEL